MTLPTESNPLVDASCPATESIQGILQEAGRASAQPAFIHASASGDVKIFNIAQQKIAEYGAGELSYSPIIPGLPVELHLPNGARFIPDDASYRWSGLKSEAHILNWLETRWIVALVAVIALPLFIWLVTFRLIPAAAGIGVAFLPPSVAEESGQQTLAILDRIYMKPSQIPEAQQAAIREQWHNTLEALSIPKANYQLHFRSGPMGPNAMALPNGDVILTDDIVELMGNSPRQLTAVMLHEIGHVEHQHGLKMMAQTAATSMLFALILGDIEGAGEMVIGAGASLTHNAFSRDMEREADLFAYEKLHQLGHSPKEFAEAMNRLMQSQTAPASADDNSALNKYLSSHPAIKERIEAARNWSPAH